MKWELIRCWTETGNTPEYGYGDYCSREEERTGLTCEAESLGEARRLAKRLFPALRFGGRWPDWSITPQDPAERKQWLREI